MPSRLHSPDPRVLKLVSTSGVHSWNVSPDSSSCQYFWDLITGMLLQGRTRDAAAVNGLLITIFKVCVFLSCML
jgi:hypothetical protein